MAGYSRSSSNTTPGWDGSQPFRSTSKVVMKSEVPFSEPIMNRVDNIIQSQMGHNLSALYKHITGEELNKNELDCHVAAIHNVDRFPKELPNETRICEKLKLYLIKQGKDEKAKQFVDLYSQLRKSKYLKNRDGIFNLFYQLFDRKAATAEILKRKSVLPPQPTTSANFIANVKALNERKTITEYVNGSGSGRPKSIASVPSHPNTLSKNAPFEIENRRERSRHDVMSLCTTRSQSSNVTLRASSSKAAVEKELIKDMLFIFQGINTANIKLVETNSKHKYEIITKKILHPSMKLQIFKQCEVGFLFRKIRSYCDKPSSGQMLQGFKHGLENELHEYYKLLVLVQDQIENNDVETPLSDMFPKTGDDLTFQRLCVFVIETKFRLDAVVMMIEMIEGKKGGEICSLLFRFSQSGDPLVKGISSGLLTIVAKPLYSMICQWILYGELEDHFMEFFIASDKDCKNENLWHSKFHIRENMLPSFISRKFAEKILSTGKNINFLRDICLNSKGYDGRNEIKQILEETPVECLFLEDDRILNNAIERAYSTTSQMVLRVLIEESRLIDHLKAIKNYLLLGQGDFIQYLLHLLQDELSKPASKLFTHNLTSILESAIRATNAQYEDDDILGRVDTRILQGSDKDTGWDVFCLDYKANGPIGTVLTDEVITRYNRLFNTLWRTKRVEGILSALWKNQTTLFKFQSAMPEIGPVLHRSQLLISEMIHFVHQTQYYIMFEATECTWEKLLQEASAATDLDQVIKAHSIFLENITKRSLLDDGKRELLNQLRGVFETVYKFQAFLTKFDARVSSELEQRRKKKTVTFSLEENRETQKDFFTEYVSLAKGEIEALYDTTQDLIRSFLLVLNRQQDSDSLTLQCLSFRLDFNEYYGRKDSRLSVPLTYQHRRMSSSFYNSPLNQSMAGLTTSFNLNASISNLSQSTLMSATPPQALDTYYDDEDEFF